MRSLLIGFAALPLLVFGPYVAFGDGPCRSGDTLIGESAQYYYCSHATCQDLGAQLSRDQLALDRLRSSINSSNTELAEWTKQNARAEKEALDDAKFFLIETVLSGITENREDKLKSIERDIRQADPTGTTLNTKLLKIANFERSYTKLVTLIYALKAAEYPGMDIYKTWADFKERATEIGKETQVLAATWDALGSDPEMQQAFREHGFEFSADSLKQALSLPLLRQSLDLGQFISDYGYDLDKWEKSRNLIMANVALDDKNLYAECVLSRHLRITVRNYNICKGKMPDDTTPRPEDIACVDHTKPDAH